MKKVSAIFSTIAYLLSYNLALADTLDTKVKLGNFGVDPGTRSIGDVISNALRIVFIAGALAVLVYLIIGAFRWITSGGDKDAIGKARGTIVNALIGLAILALAFFIVVVVGRVLNIDIINLPKIPTLNDTPTSSTN